MALVTGASKGVGRGIALGLARAGHDVAINYHHDRQGAEKTARDINSLGRRAWILQGDVGKLEDVTRIFHELESEVASLDAMVNNSGVQTWANLLELSEKDWDRTIQTNLKGTFLCTQSAGRWIKQAGARSSISDRAQIKHPSPI